MRRFLGPLHRVAIPRLTLLLTAVSASCLVASQVQPDLLDLIPLVPERVMHGEGWRLVTFLAYPLSRHPVFAAFTYYLFYLMGTALESEWGDAKFNLYVALSWLATVLTAWLNPTEPAINGYIYGSIFLAFAFLHPDFMLYLLFIIPVKMKYLAAFQWIMYGALLLLGSWTERAILVAANANFFLFFGRAVIGNLRAGRHRMESKAQAIREQAHPFHLCHVCRLTEQKDPRMDFRVCPTCTGALEYCQTHLETHTHISR